MSHKGTTMNEWMDKRNLYGVMSIIKANTKATCAHCSNHWYARVLYNCFNMPQKYINEPFVYRLTKIWNTDGSIWKSLSWSSFQERPLPSTTSPSIAGTVVVSEDSIWRHSVTEWVVLQTAALLKMTIETHVKPLAAYRRDRNITLSQLSFQCNCSPFCSDTQHHYP